MRLEIPCLRRAGGGALAAAFLGIAITGSAFAAEIREWTDIKGRKLMASLVTVDGEEVVLKLENGRDATVKRSTLSLADQNYLNEFAANPFGSGDGVPTTLKSPAKEVDIDRSTWVKPEEGFTVGSRRFDNVIETERFILAASERLNMRAAAEHAERLWHDTAFFHPSFTMKWRDGKRMIILLTNTEEDWMAIGEWYAQMLRDQQRGEDANDLLRTWPQSSSSNVFLDDETASKLNVHRYARVVKVTDANEKAFEDVWNPFRTHLLAGDLLSIQMGGVSSFGSEGLFWLTTGYSYFKEIQLCEEVGTKLITFDEQTEDVKESELFDDPRRWPETVKRMVRRGDVEPDIEALYEVTRQNLTPELAGLCFGFNAFLQSTPARMGAYSKLISRVETSNQIPVPIELAKVYGYESVEAMEEAWIEFMKSPDFK